MKNWAGNLTYSTGHVVCAHTVEEVRDCVKGHTKLKVLGSGHCFNRIADSHHCLLSLKPMNRVLSLDREQLSVTVEAGITYGQLAPYLHSQGFALANLASLPHISVAGSCSTATHGSGETTGNLATQLLALQLVNAEGEILQLSRAGDPDIFPAAAVGLGALGVLTQLTLQIEPTYLMQQSVYHDLPFDTATEHFDQIQASAYSLSLFTDWQAPRFHEVWVKSRRLSEPEPSFFGAARATRPEHPVPELAASNCTDQSGAPGPWHERLPHFKMGFRPSVGNELQSEYILSRRHAAEAMGALLRMRDVLRPALLVAEVRSIGADQLWMSPCNQEASLGIHFTWRPDWERVSQILPHLERELSPFQAKPHWGKLFAMPPPALRTCFPALGRFEAVCRRLDPGGKFRNHFLDQRVFG